MRQLRWSRQSSVWLLCVGLFISFNVTAAPNLGGLIKSVAQTNTSPAKKEVEQLPDPRSLGMGWSSFLDLSPEDLQARSQQLIEDLTETANQLPEEDRVAALTSLRRLQTGLTALAEARQRKDLPPPKPTPLQETYTIQQLLNVYSELLSSQRRLRQEKDTVRQMRSSLSTADQYQDDLMINYGKLESRSKERIIKGLEIMANRTAILVNRERLRIHQALLKNAEIVVDQSEEEFSEAKERLVANDYHPSRSEKLIEEAKEEVLASQKRLYTEEAQLLETIPDTPLDQVRANFEQQQLLLERTREAQARVRLLSLQAEQALAEALRLKDQPEQFVPPFNLAEQEQLLKELQGYNEVWQERTSSQYSRVQSISFDDVDESLNRTLDSLTTQLLETAKETLNASSSLRQEIAKAELLLDLTSKLLYVDEPEPVRWVYTAWDGLSSFLVGLSSWLESTLFRIDDEPITPLEILQGFLIIGLAWLLSKAVRLGLRRMSQKQKRIARSTFYTLGRLAHYVILTLGVLLSLSVVGIHMTNLLLVAGALSVGIGFGLQDIVNNFLSGLIILFERIFRVGDYLEIEDGTRGSVTQINVRSTVLRTNDGLEVVIPNSDLISHKVTNWTMQDTFRRMKIEFGVSYTSDKNIVKQAALEAADRVPFTLRNIPGYKAPEIWLSEFGDSSLNFTLVVWVNALAARRPTNTKAAYLWEIHSALQEHGIEIPFPQRDLYIKEWPSEGKS